MKSRLGRALLWSSVGSVLVGGVVAAVARRPRKRAPVALDAHRIPSDCRRALVWTEPFESDGDGRTTRARDLYVLESTPFRVWSVLELSIRPVQAETVRGTSIYHVTRVRVTERTVGGGVPGEVRERLERFYATAATSTQDGQLLGKSVLARGGTLEFVLCNVGGSSNGVETDQVHRSLSPILNFRFEYTERPDEPGENTEHSSSGRSET
jgi:hypothetical protein